MPKFRLTIIDVNDNRYESDIYESPSLTSIQIDFSRELATANTLLFPNGEVVLTRFVVAFQAVEVKDDEDR